LQSRLLSFYTYVNPDESHNHGDYGVDITTGIEIIEYLIGIAGISYTIEEEDTVIHVGVILQY